MRRSILALALATVLSLALSGVVAAGQATQTLGITGNVSFSSILGGSVNGIGSISGDVTDGQVGTLKGTVNFPLRDETLTVSPSTTLALVTDPYPINWSWFTGCDQFGCHFISGTSIYQRRHAEGLVDVRLGQLKGSGYLSVNMYSGCISDCPPPFVFINPPVSGASLSGAVLGNKDAGTYQLWGQPVVN